MTDIMMALGDYRFSLSTATYESLRRNDSWRWIEMARLGRTPVHQYMGPGSTEITLDGTILPHYRGGLGQIESMRSEASKGTSLRLVDGRGRIWGGFVIKSISETHSRFFEKGIPLKIDFSVSLTAYGEDS